MRGSRLLWQLASGLFQSDANESGRHEPLGDLASRGVWGSTFTQKFGRREWTSNRSRL